MCEQACPCYHMPELVYSRHTKLCPALQLLALEHGRWWRGVRRLKYGGIWTWKTHKQACPGPHMAALRHHVTKWWPYDTAAVQSTWPACVPTNVPRPQHGHPRMTKGMVIVTWAWKRMWDIVECHHMLAWVHIFTFMMVLCAGTHYYRQKYLHK